MPTNARSHALYEEAEDFRLFFDNLALISHFYRCFRRPRKDRFADTGWLCGSGEHDTRGLDHEFGLSLAIFVTRG